MYNCISTVATGRTSFQEIQDLEDVALLGDDDETEEEETFLEMCNVIGVKELDYMWQSRVENEHYSARE